MAYSLIKGQFGLRANWRVIKFFLLLVDETEPPHPSTSPPLLYSVMRCGILVLFPGILLEESYL